jgi:ABC-2 type transport system permease protein
LQGTLMVIACLIAGFRPTSVITAPLGLLFMLLIAIVFVALGVSIGSSLQDMQGFQLIMSFLVMPLFFLSGALFPLDHLPKLLTVLTSLDPLSYGVDGLRGALTGATQFGMVRDLLVLMVVALAALCLGAWRFSEIEV